MARLGQACVRETEALTQRIADAEAGNAKLPDVNLSSFSDSIPNIVGSWLARAVCKYQIKLYGFVAMSNHLHMLVQAPLGNLSEFMAYLNGRIAREVNRFLGRRHQLWARRYAAGQVLDEPAEMERLFYILSNPQKAGLVHSIEQWPGVSSAPFLLEGRNQRFLSFNRSQWYRDGRPSNIAAYLSTIELNHEILPQLQRMGAEERRVFLENGLRTARNERLNAHFQDAQGDEDRKALLRDDIAPNVPTDRPEKPKQSPQPLCHTTVPELLRAFVKVYRQFVHFCQERGREYKAGYIHVLFPPGAFAPSRFPIARVADDSEKDNLPSLTRDRIRQIAAQQRETMDIRACCANSCATSASFQALRLHQDEARCHRPAPTFVRPSVRFGH